MGYGGWELCVSHKPFSFPVVLTIGFNVNALSVSEDDGELAGLISVAIQDGGITEQFPEVSLSYSEGLGQWEVLELDVKTLLKCKKDT